MKRFSFILFLFLSFALLYSCEKEVTETMSTTQEFSDAPSDVNVIKQLIKEKIAQANPVSESRQDFCQHFDGPDCISIVQVVTIPVNITECSTEVTDPCDVIAEMEMIICVDPLTQEVEVSFHESLFGHASSCITGPGHTDDWECLAELVYIEYQNLMMPIILQLYQFDNACDGGRSTVVVNYSREVCVYPCTELLNGFYISRLVQCGGSTACCLQESSWCIDEEGKTQVTEGETYMVGNCTPSLIPCQSKFDPFPPLDLQCSPRACRQAVYNP